MAGSPKCVPDSPAVAAQRGLTDPRAALAAAVAALAPGTPIAVACSGGADSAALAVAAAGLRSDVHPVHLFHVHHGLAPQADQWLARVERLAALLNLPLSLRYVRVATDLGLGVEGAAREARYDALREMAADVRISVILLAHHRRDQAETVLLRLLRGAGVHGMAAMRPDSVRGGLRLLRPWLDVDREQIAKLIDRFAQVTDWLPVEDASNTDPGYARGALRSTLAPALRAHWPAWEQTLTRHARQAADVAGILGEVAAGDLESLDCDPNDASFSLLRWRALSAPRQALVIRHWLAGQGARMPGERRLDDLLRQLRNLHALGHDRNLVWRHGALEVRCLRGRVVADVPGAASS